MERPIFKPIGTPAEELDTPALVVDLDVIGQNIETFHSFFGQREAKIRPHVGSHLCPAIAHMQLQGGATVGGICTTTVAQAEVFSEGGFADIFVTNKFVTPQKMVRLCALARHAKVIVAVDNPLNVERLSEAAVAGDVTINVVVEVNTGSNGSGVKPGQAALNLARRVMESKRLLFAGLASFQGPTPTDGNGKLFAESRGAIQQVLDTREMLEGAGIEVQVVSVGGTWNYETAAGVQGVTEVPASTYALMDYRTSRYSTRLRPAARVMATVTSRPQQGTAITDCGQKSIGRDYGLPVVENIPGVKVSSLSAEHGKLILEGDTAERIDLGDKIWMTPWDIGTCVNLYDYAHCVRNGKLEAVWSIAARGQYH